MGLEAVSSLLVAASDLALVRSIRGAIRAADEAVGSFASKPAEASYSPQPSRASDTVTLTPEVRYAPRPVIHPTPRIEPRPVVHTADRTPVVDPSMRPGDCSVTTLSKPLPPPWREGMVKVGETYGPGHVGMDARNGVKITVRRADSYLRGVMIDFFC